MKSVLTPEDKQKLRMISAYLNSYSESTGELVIDDVDIGYSDLSKINVTEWTEFNSNRHIPIPEILYPILDKIFKSSQELFDNMDFDVEGINYGKIEFEIKTNSQKVSLTYVFYYYDTGEEYSTTITLEDDEDLNKVLDEVRELEEVLPLMELRYNGSGDSGYIESQFENSQMVPASVEDFCYRWLENQHGGWEINEGSQGTFYIDLKRNQITLEHQFNEEKIGSETFYEESFAD